MHPGNRLAPLVPADMTEVGEGLEGEVLGVEAGGAGS